MMNIDPNFKLLHQLPQRHQWIEQVPWPPNTDIMRSGLYPG